MTDKSLTKAYIQTKKRNSLSVNLNISLADIKELKNYQYLLVIHSSSSKCVKAMVYPIKKEKIIKISLWGPKTSNKIIEDLSEVFQNYDIIHTSGLLIKKKQFFYECYLNLSLSDMKSKHLKASLDKIKNRFNKISIEEIGLKKSEKVKI
ncbi:MAG: hypothetical protein ACFFAN_06275 [Promethearchaeota archaeon]